MIFIGVILHHESLLHLHISPITKHTIDVMFLKRHNVIRQYHQFHEDVELFISGQQLINFSTLLLPSLGGLSEEEASIYLNTMNKIQRKGPWSVTFSYGRALQQSTLKTWGGKAENIPAAQAALLARAQANSEANLGKYVAGSQPSADGTLFVKGYKY